MSSEVVDQKAVLKSAAHWYAVLCAEDVDEGQVRAHQKWLNAHPSHLSAWLKVDQLRQQLIGMPGSTAMKTLRIKDRQHIERRSVLRGLAMLATAGSLGAVAWQSETMESALASHRTAKGKVSVWSLDNGTQLVLNTSTAVEVIETTAETQLRLLHGEIYIRTAKQRGITGGGRLKVLTDQGQITPLGTVFTVSQDSQSTRVIVIEDAVEVVDNGRVQRVTAGTQALLEPNGMQLSPAPKQPDSWTRGQLVAVNWRLAELLQELQRYHHSYLRCDPKVANLRITGVFPTQDRERALQAIINALPVKIDRVTNLWITVKPI